jgi:hypothetical protein
MFEAALNFLRQNNTGVCNHTGKLFGEVIQHFVIGGDEACLMADDHGDLRIIGAAGIKKHEKKTSDTRCSITLFRTGVTSGHNGPTAFLLKGVRRRAGYTDKFLEVEGCEKGSCFAMTDNAFMTDAAWTEISHKASLSLVLSYYLFSPINALIVLICSR